MNPLRRCRPKTLPPLTFGLRPPAMTPLLHQISGLAIPELACEFGTPFYVYDAATIVQRINNLASFDVVRYAQKACSNIAILDLARRHDVVVDAVSGGEIHRALAAGYKPGFGEPPEIVYTADIFDRESLELVVELDLPVNCGSPDMITQYGERVPGKPITLRINPGFGHGHSQKTNTGGEQSKHGIWHEQIEECIERANEYDLSIAGLHMHIGSGTDMEHLSQVCAALEKTALAVGSSINSDQCRRRAAHAVPRRRRSGRHRRVLRAVGRYPRSTGRGIRPPRFAGDRTGTLPGCREWLPGSRDPGDQADGWQQVLPARRRFQQSGPPHHVRLLPSDGCLPGEWR